jgi:hypothetical protein
MVPYAARWRPREKPVAGIVPFEGVSSDARLLGTAGAIPPPKRRLPATLVRMGGGLALLDRVEEARTEEAGGPAGAYCALRLVVVTDATSKPGVAQGMQ